MESNKEFNELESLPELKASVYRQSQDQTADMVIVSSHQLVSQKSQIDNSTLLILQETSL